mmetsp:Transcript_96967/g.269809  ORF Transcript_96967/g.269809 Transcript_96967/m.269809 type:complete len:276 (+) Transcript_96967:872-1699(+)
MQLCERKLQLISLRNGSRRLYCIHSILSGTVADSFSWIQLEDLVHHSLCVCIDAAHRNQHLVQVRLSNVNSVKLPEILLHPRRALSFFHAVEGVELHAWCTMWQAQLLRHHLAQIGPTAEHSVVLQEVVCQQQQGMCRVGLQMFQVSRRCGGTLHCFLSLAAPVGTTKLGKVGLQSRRAQELGVVNRTQDLSLCMPFQSLEQCQVPRQPCRILADGERLVVDHLHPRVVHRPVVVLQGSLEEPLRMTTFPGQSAIFAHLTHVATEIGDARDSKRQ